MFERDYCTKVVKRLPFDERNHYFCKKKILMPIFNTLVVRFQTSANTPPPHCFEYVLSLKPSFQYLQADLQLVYTHRDGLDIEEIEDEGFTTNDDYQWSGNLEKIWREKVEELLPKTTLTNHEPTDDNDYIAIEIADDKGDTSGFPKKATEWQYLAQELLQAVFETSGKEKSFQFSILRNTDTDSQELTLTASFRYRDVQLRRNENGTPKFRNYHWDELPTVMQTIYGPDYLSDQALPKKPLKELGTFLNFGDELWYELGKQVAEPNRSSNTLMPLRKLIEKLLRY
jgi:hypothetical protein